MTAYKPVLNGGWAFTEMVGNRFITRRYLGYKKRDALRLFKAEIAKLRKEAGE